MMEESSENKTTINRFNIRVYGIALNEKNEVLLCNEKFKGKTFTKFPGGGLEFGEGIIDCLQREFKEELDVQIEFPEHFYTTSFFQRSAFVETEQIISIYYSFKITSRLTNLNFDHDPKIINFFWKSADSLSEEDVTFPIDKIVMNKIITQKIKY